MDKQEIETKVKETLAQRLDVKIEEIRLESSLADNLGMDSLGAFEVVFGLADVFKIEIPDEDFVKIETVKDIVDYIFYHLNENKRQ